MNQEFFDAFISYGRPDSKDFAIRLHKKLESQGYNIWLDQNDIPFGVDFPEEIKQGIAKSQNFLFIISPHAIHSPYCKEEIDYAVQYNKRILPLLHVETINRQTWQQRNPMGTDQEWQQYCSQGKHSCFTQMRPEISKVNWIYFREEIDDFEGSVTALMEVFQRDQDYVYQHTKLLTQALQWETHKKQSQYLLIGQERLDATKWLQRKFFKQQPPCEPTFLHCEFICESEKNANDDRAKVFISYLDHDQVFVDKLCCTLRQNGQTIWTRVTDKKIPENFYYKNLVRLEKSDNFFYVFSQKMLDYSSDQELCEQEIKYALALNKRVFVLELNSGDFGEFSSLLSETEVVDFSQYEDEQKYKKTSDQLIRTILEESEYHQQHKILLVKALQWEQQNKYPTLLLRGKSLQEAMIWLETANKRSRYQPIPLQKDYILTSSQQPTITSFDVVISHSYYDLDFANQLNDALEIQGKVSYFDAKTSEKKKNDQLEDKQVINRCDNFILIISPDSKNLEDRQEEIDYAQRLNKRIIVVLYCFTQEQDIPIKGKETIYFSRNKADFMSKFNELIRVLETDRSHVHSHTKCSGKALEWEQNHRHEDYLLRGNELVIAQTWLEDAKIHKKEPTITQLQREFIEQSQQLRDRLSRQKELQRQQQLRQARRITLGAVIAGVILACSTTITLIELRHAHIDEIKTLIASSQADLESGQALDALEKGLEAHQNYRDHWTKWITWLLPIAKLPDHLSLDIFDSVREAANHVREKRVRIETQSGLSTLTVSPDHDILALGSQQGRVKLFYSIQGEFHPLNPSPTPYGDKIMDLSFSPDRKRLAIASWRTAVRIWDLEEKKYIETLAHESWINRLSFSPDGRTLATASVNGKISLWRVKENNGTKIEKQKDFDVDGSAIALTFSQDSRYLGVGTNRGQVVIRDNQEESLTRLSAKSGVHDLAFSPDGRLLALALSDGLGQVWRWQTGEKISQLEGHENRVNAITFSPDGQQLATASEDTSVRLWDLQGNRLQRFPGHKEGATQLKYIGDYLFATAANGMLHRWDLTWKKLPELQGHISSVYQVQFSPGGQYLATASADQTARLWNLQGEQLAMFPHDGAVTSVSFNSDSQLLLSGAADGIARIWSLEDKTLQTSVLEGYSDQFYRVSFNPKQSYWIAGASYGEIRAYQDQINKLKHPTTSELITDLSFSSDGQHLATASFNKGVLIWKTQELLTNLRNPKPKTLDYPQATSIAFNPKNKMLAVSSKNGQISLWNSQGQQIRNWQAHQESILSVSFSHNGQYLATGSWDGTARLWNLQGEKLAQFTSHAGPVFSVAFSPHHQCLSLILNPKIKGDCLATTSSDGTVYLWRVESEKELLKRACDLVKERLNQKENHFCKGIDPSNK
ncbi:MAG: TIR domain-containing protein [Crocosphaera sp.]|nr:TIR domain-containing protein [Crocosphaera sp.]